MEKNKGYRLNSSKNCGYFRLDFCAPGEHSSPTAARSLFITRITALLVGLLALATLPASAADLPAQLTHFFQACDAQHAAGMTVAIKTPQVQ
nr:Flagellar hook protein FlgE [Candidatus Pantoea persica]